MHRIRRVIIATKSMASDVALYLFELSLHRFVLWRHFDIGAQCSKVSVCALKNVIIRFGASHVH